MRKTTTNRLKKATPIILFLVLVTIVILALGTTGRTEETPAPEPSPSFNNEAELESAAAYNAEQALQLINVNIEEELTEEQISKLEITTDAVTETDEETETQTKTALMLISGLPENFNVDNSTQFIKNFVEEENPDGNPWEYQEAAKESFDETTNIETSIIIWETGENPTNPVVLTFTYTKVEADEQNNTQAGYEIHIQSQISQ